MQTNVLTLKNIGFLNLEIEGYSKIVINCFYKRINVPYSIMILMKNIWKLSKDLIKLIEMWIVSPRKRFVL